MQSHFQKALLLAALVILVAFSILSGTEGFSSLTIGEDGTESQATNELPSTLTDRVEGQVDSDLTTSAPKVLVNEVLAHTDLPQRDFIELYNATSEPANIGGWFISDKLEKPRKFRIPDGTQIPSYGYVVFDEYQLDFAFGAEGESAYLFAADASGNLTGYQHGFSFGVTPNGFSLGRCEVAVADTQMEEHFTLQRAITEGAGNSAPLVGPIVISELLYAPQNGDEFIELRNISNRPAPLYDPAAPANQWQLEGIGSYTMPPDISIPPNGTLLVVSIEPDLFRSRYGVPSSVQIVGPYSGKLSDEGERVVLLRPDVPNSDGSVPYIEADVVGYNVSSPWPDLRTNGKSLARIDVTKFGNTHVNWQESTSVGGSPGVASMTRSRTLPKSIGRGQLPPFAVSYLFLPLIVDESPLPQVNPCL